MKRFLAARGYAAKGEVQGCDVAAVRLDPADDAAPLLIITELKLGFTLELVLQAVDRAAVADQVWLAVRSTRRGRDRDSRVRTLCRRLGFGLLGIPPGRGEAEVLVEPGPWRPRTNQRRRRAVLAEHAARAGDPTPGGSRAAPVMTAYRQEALACAAALRAAPCRPRDLASSAPRAARILQRNVYGWFRRVSHGVYGLTGPGEAAVQSAMPGYATDADSPALGLPRTGPER